MRRALSRILLLACTAALLWSASGPIGTAMADEPPAKAMKPPAGISIVPDKFLRRWDPVTIFFDRNAGPANGGPEHAPEKFATVTPPVAGAFTWLNGRTLQFRPAEPWPALTRYTWHVGDRSIVIASLMEAPQTTLPANNATGLEPVDSLTLDFAQPVDPKALAQMIEIDMTPLPGLNKGQASRIDPQDFEIKPIERSERSGKAVYVVALRKPIPSGTHTVVTLKLSTEPGLDATVERFSFDTAEAFRPIFLGCAEKRVPVSAEGISYGKEAALSCRTEAVAADDTGGGRRAHRHVSQEQAASGDAAPADQGGDNNAPDNGDNAPMDNGAGDNNADDNSSGDNSSSDNGAADNAPDNSDNTAAANAADTSQPASDGSIVDPTPLKAPLSVTSDDNPALGSGGASASQASKMSTKREIVVQFSSLLGAVDPIAARNLVRITPSVDGMKSEVVGDQLHVTARFQTDTLYEIALEPTPLKDTRQRDLQMSARSAVYVFWKAEAPFLDLSYGAGIVERFGPQMIPMRGRGYDEADVRIHAVDPLDRSFWPFPAKPVIVDEDQRPPSPGEAAAPHAAPAPINGDEIAQQIARLGSPNVSDLQRLPLATLGVSAKFGLDLAPALTRIAGKTQPGTYLVGVRRLDNDPHRQWMRVQVTDLSLSAVEEEKAVRFYVTSLSDGKPIAKAQIRIEGGDHEQWVTIASGETAEDGHFIWTRPDLHAQPAQLRRIVVTKGEDVMVLDPAAPPDRYSADGWFPGGNDWLDWMQGDLSHNHPAPKTLCHVFTERPIYRPDDPVHIKAYVRRLADGALTPGGQGVKAEIVVTGPDDAEWRYPAAIDDGGSVHYLFDEKTTATGLYQAHLDINHTHCASMSFLKDAYRLPKFQVQLQTPKTIPLDRTATVGMTAIYYAGGAASDRPVRWRVTQFPYAFTPKPRDGFVYATDAKYESRVPFDSTATLEIASKTDGEGRDTLTLDPTREKTNAPRRYVVEATVTGDDDKTVTNTEDVLAVPAFVLGVKAPRYIEKADRIPVELLMVDGAGNPIAGKSMTVRLLQRQWSSILEAGDFTRGKPKYRTEIVDEKRLEKTVASGTDALKLDLPISESGVYVVELEATDELGRRQLVSVDLFAGGNQPVTWSRPPAQVFKVTTDKPGYGPGETATLVLESPFQTARALAIVETPDGANRYDWLDVANGYGKYDLTIDKTYMPRIPVHFVLMRPRLKAGPDDDLSLDLKRPQTLAATAWVGVKPTKNVVTVKVDNPDAAQPGDTIDLTVKLSDDEGKPVGGEVTLWMIDQAVLALAKEAPLDPLPNFIRDRGSKVALADTRNSVLGYLPLDEDPGGDVGAGDQALLNKVTIRKNFTPVPYYNPALKVDASGTVTVSIKLPDNLTNFKIRAKAISGPDRFGFATGQIAVRLPVIVEPNLPRFVRPGDQFALAAIGRIVEGGGGPGRAEAKIDGLDVAGPLTRDIEWEPGKPQIFEFAATVPSPSYTDAGVPSRDTVTVTLGVERMADKARDAFSVPLPIKPDRGAVHERKIVDLTSATPFVLPAVDTPARPGTFKRSILVSSQPALVRLMAGLSYLRQYPFGCTEQRVSAARAEIAAKQFAAALLVDQPTDHVQRSVTETAAWIATVTDEGGLTAFWPGARGEIMPTAWSLEFLVEARKAGFAIDEAQIATLKRGLKQALRSDYANFVSGESYVERSWALAALAASGDLDRGYAAELLRKVNFLSIEGVAEVRSALVSAPAVDEASLKTLDDALWKGIVVKLRNGNQVYGGLQEGSVRSPLILPSETRTVAEVLRALSNPGQADPRRQMLVAALVTLGTGDGWGTTNANGEALLALSRFVGSDTGMATQAISVTMPDGAQQVTVGSDQALKRLATNKPGEITVTALAATDKAAIGVRSDLSYVPTEDGSHVAPSAAGFVVSREIAILDPTGAPARRQKLDKPALTIALDIGDVVEDSVELVNPIERHHVAIVVPLAAGEEPLNPALKTAPPEATPSAEPTLAPTYTAFLDDQVAYFYETLPKGTFSFHFRSKAAVPGKFIQPAAYATMMYDEAVNGSGAGALVTVTRPATP
jgi:uncharacterized protein YfaS (alpha-2-macroglobulin family)